MMEELLELAVLLMLTGSVSLHRQIAEQKLSVFSWVFCINGLFFPHNSLLTRAAGAGQRSDRGGNVSVLASGQESSFTSDFDFFIFRVCVRPNLNTQQGETLVWAPPGGSLGQSLEI